jgi:hypothetical protein
MRHFAGRLASIIKLLSPGTRPVWLHELLVRHRLLCGKGVDAGFFAWNPLSVIAVHVRGCLARLASLVIRFKERGRALSLRPDEKLYQSQKSKFAGCHPGY